MDRERLARLLEEPARVAQEDLGALRTLRQRYPWFAGAHLLVAHGEMNSDDVLADATLRDAAAHLPTRTVLFDAFSPVQAELPPAAPPAPPVPIPPRHTPVATPALEAVAPPTPPPAPPAPPAPVPMEAEAPVHGMLPEVPVEPPDPAGADVLEHQILEAALASAYELTATAPVLDTQPPPPPSPPPAAPARPAENVEEDMGTVGEELRASLDVGPDTRLRFTDWLTVPPAKPPMPPKAPLSAGEADALVDRFIQSQMPEPRPRATFFDPHKAARKSLEDNAGLVTETLAAIYAKQGNVAKAIAAYRELALKYPGKSSYFAALIEKLEGRNSA